MNSVHIIGIGSPFGDDRIGWDAIDALERDGMLDRFPPGCVRAFRCAQPARDLLPMMTGADVAILIDAMIGGAAPGCVKRIDPLALRADPGKLSSHAMSVAESLALGRALGLLPEKVLIYGVGIRLQGATAPASSGDETKACINALLHELAAELPVLLGQAGRPAS